MKNIEYILSMVNQVCKDSDWQAFDFFCSGEYCRLINSEDEYNQPTIELWIEYELVASITEEWTENGEWFDKIKVFDASWNDFFNQNTEYMGSYAFIQGSEEVPDPT